VCVSVIFSVCEGARVVYVREWQYGRDRNEQIEKECDGDRHTERWFANCKMIVDLQRATCSLRCLKSRLCCDIMEN